MKAVTCHDGELEVVDLPSPTPARGQVLLDVLRCGICGSDLHARKHADQLADLTARVGYDGIMRSQQHVIMGHEFCGEIAAYGPGTRRRWRPGTRVVAMPLRRNAGASHPIGLSESAPGAYAEQILVEESLTFPVPNGLSSELAALTEPMAVALHAVRRAEIRRGGTAIVIGCGPIGLAVIGMLKARGVRHVVASDYSPARRDLARQIGADLVVDPSVDSPYAGCADQGHIVDASTVFDLALTAMGKLRRLPIPWEPIWRVAEAAGAVDLKHPVIFECVGVPGVIESIVDQAPLRSRIVVVGVCMDRDHLQPALAINKEIDLRFVLGYTPIEFRDTLHMLADGKINAAPLVTGTVGLNGVGNAFTALADPGQHAKILIDPRSTTTTP
nr:zinc-binding dehydrogenase [Kibdelosporangium sp. MJ126-NF4]CEL13082.1 2,3-butanediol dehydrogenase, R-alcohol forming, (R)-and (S)-acetoin-specific [Kibdelosporangium sp. MJ126-NF4]CTQ98769.1 2,3-butanediol dehydrogenase, R-alcohol forming, (R)-and (S)-acetoin-specific (EC 1.1.1.4) [Kibdelosporangium sp. MJ126-NF4]